MSDNIQTKNWVGTDADDHFIIDNINYDDISNSYHDIRGGLGNDIYEVNLDTGNLNYYRGGEGNDTYILYRGGGIYVDEINADGDDLVSDDGVYIQPCQDKDQHLVRNIVVSHLLRQSFDSL